MIEFTMPALGADMDEGMLNEWMVKQGDTVTRGQIVAVVETTKAAVEIECWHDGVVHELLVPIGQTVAVGTVLATLLEPGEQPGPSLPKDQPAAADTLPVAPTPAPAPHPPRLQPRSATGCGSHRWPGAPRPLSGST